MEAIIVQLQAMMLNSRRNHRCITKRDKATYHAMYYKSHRFAINHTKAIKCGNAHGKHNLNVSLFKSRTSSWDASTEKFY